MGGDNISFFRQLCDERTTNILRLVDERTGAITSTLASMNEHMKEGFQEVKELSDEVSELKRDIASINTALYGHIQSHDKAWTKAHTWFVGGTMFVAILTLIATVLMTR